MLFHIILYILFGVYTFAFWGLYQPSSLFTDYISLILYIIIVVWYYIRNRRNVVFCPELLYFIFSFVITFFDVAILAYTSAYSSLYTLFDNIEKSRCLSMIGFIVFVYGLELGNKKGTSALYKNRIKKIRTFPRLSIKIFHCIVTILMILFYLSGGYSLLFKYGQESTSGGNMGLVLTSTCLMCATVIEFINLKSKNTRLNNFFSNVNKIYLVNIVTFSLLLFLTGNRGELLCIILPPIILFYFYIHKLSNLTILMSAIIGLSSFVILGHTRNSDLSVSDVTSEINLYDTFRDFGAAYVNQQGLIQYADSKGFYGLSSGVKTAISSIPFLGGIILGESNETIEGNTNNLTTDQWQLASREGSGLGSSLYGDLYYNGGIPLLVVYIFFLGYLLSYVFTKLNSDRSINIILLFVFLWVFSNIIYLQRSTYFYLFRYIGFTLTIYFLFYFITSLVHRRKIV